MKLTETETNLLKRFLSTELEKGGNEFTNVLLKLEDSLQERASILNEQQIEKIKQARKGYILQELKECRNEIERFDDYKIMHQYKNFIKGLAVGLGAEAEDVEHELDNKFLGSHDLNLLLRSNSLSELYKFAKQK